MDTFSLVLSILSVVTNIIVIILSVIQIADSIKLRKNLKKDNKYI